MTCSLKNTDLVQPMRKMKYEEIERLKFIRKVSGNHLHNSVQVNNWPLEYKFSVYYLSVLDQDIIALFLPPILHSLHIYFSVSCSFLLMPLNLILVIWTVFV